MAIEIVPEWMTNLEDEDVVFIKKFFGDLGFNIKFNNNHSIIFFTKMGD